MLRIPKSIVENMIDHSRSESPNECCGILAGKDGTIANLYRITNIVKSPYRYLMEPQEFLNADKDSESNGWEFLAFYHSHTHSPAYPSQTDVRMAQQSGYFEVHYILVSVKDEYAPLIKAFHIAESGDIVEEQFEVIS